MSSLSKIDIDDIQPGYTLGHADAAILRDELRELLAYREAQGKAVAGFLITGVNGRYEQVAGEYINDDDVVKLYAAPQLPAVPDGWALVPKEMTDGIGEAISYEAGCCGGIALDIYEAMLAAAPKPE